MNEIELIVYNCIAKLNKRIVNMPVSFTNIIWYVYDGNQMLTKKEKRINIGNAIKFLMLNGLISSAFSDGYRQYRINDPQSIVRAVLAK
jgi:hypothetical protein